MSEEHERIYTGIHVDLGDARKLLQQWGANGINDTTDEEYERDVVVQVYMTLLYRPYDKENPWGHSSTEIRAWGDSTQSNLATISQVLASDG